jgi:predicted Zn-dependent protease
MPADLKDREAARAFLARVLEMATAKHGGAAAPDEAEASLGGGHMALTRFAENTIHQNVAERGFELSVRVVLGKRTGRATTRRVDDEGVKACVETARSVARLAPEDPELLPCPGPQEYAKVEANDAATAALTPVARAEAVKAVVDACAAKGAKAAGAYRVEEGSFGDYGEAGELALANTRGLFAHHVSTSASFTTTVAKGDVSGWATGDSWRVADLDTARLGAVALEKALAAADPGDVEPGKYTVLLEPAAVAELMWSLAGGFSGQAVDEGRSFLCGRIGGRIGAESVTIVEDFAHPLQRGTPFDGEGTARKRVVLVEKGVQKGLVHDRKTARKLGAEPTGHAPRQPSAWGPYPTSVVFEGGKGGVADLLPKVAKGILVTRFWYTNTVDERQAILTGMTRDGTYQVEGGKIVRAVKNLRFNQNLLDLLGAIEAIGAPQRMMGTVVPPLIVRDFNFTSSTKF